MFKDSLFRKIEEKTNVDKNTIISLANKLQNGNMKDEKTLSDLIDDLEELTKTKVSEEKKQKIINTIINDKVPDNLDNMV